MRVRANLEVKGGDTLGTVRGFLGHLLETGVVEALVVPLETPAGEGLRSGLVDDPAQLEGVNPFAPVLPANGAELLAALTAEGGRRRVGAVLRCCQMRDLRALAEREKVNLDHVTIIGVDCMGTYAPQDYAQLLRTSGKSPAAVTQELLRWTRQGQISPYRFREACQVCQDFVPQEADIAIGAIGLDARRELLVTAPAEVIGRLGLVPGEAPHRQAVIARVQRLRQRRREKMAA
ncbi:MAG: Coenzyme F420 hydrogenase/dehydrogenase, beta subunit C-terminal domain [Anaerolineae bacterium]